jgi:hypothetical protein
LRCNPNHPILINNMAFTHIHLGNLKEAESLLGTLPEEVEPNIRTTARATRGLLEFRKGNLEVGRATFLEVIDEFVTRNEHDQAGRAATQLALEELNWDTPFLMEAVQRSLRLTGETTASNVIHKVQELENAVEAYLIGKRG